MKLIQVPLLKNKKQPLTDWISEEIDFNGPNN